MPPSTRADARLALRRSQDYLVRAVDDDARFEQHRGSRIEAEHEQLVVAVDAERLIDELPAFAPDRLRMMGAIGKPTLRQRRPQQLRKSEAVVEVPVFPREEKGIAGAS